MFQTALQASLRRLIAVGLALATAACSPSSGSDDAHASDSSRVIPARVDPAPPPSLATGDTATLVVYKSPTCGCCREWVSRMKDAGFHVVVHDTEDMDAVKSASNVPADLRACHTAVIGKYVIEGHVPPADIRRLLREAPAVAGVAVPGMPTGSPGMEGGVPERYDVVAFGGSAARRVFASH
jgi:hypothetical protein